VLLSILIDFPGIHYEYFYVISEEELVPQKKRRGGRAPAADRKWMKKDLCSSPSDWSADTPAFLQRDMTPAYIFELFFDDEVINYTVWATWSSVNHIKVAAHRLTVI